MKNSSSSDMKEREKEQKFDLPSTLIEILCVLPIMNINKDKVQANIKSTEWWYLQNSFAFPFTHSTAFDIYKTLISILKSEIRQNIYWIWFKLFFFFWGWHRKSFFFKKKTFYSADIWLILGTVSTFSIHRNIIHWKTNEKLFLSLPFSIADCVAWHLCTMNFLKYIKFDN